MKKSISYLFFFCCTILCCDVVGQAMAHSHVKLDLQEIVSIDVGQATVELEMNQVSHFVEGSPANELINHVKVTSFPSGLGYEVRVKASNENFNGPSIDIPVSTVKIEAIAGNDPGFWNKPGAITFNPVHLNIVEQVLLESTYGSIAQEFDVTYSIPADQTVKFLNKNAGVYSTTVEYSVIPY